MRRITTALAVFVLMLTPGIAHATPYDLFGLGARSQALGMTGVSYSEDYEAALSNPAGLGRARRRGIHIGLTGGAYHLQIDGQRDPRDSVRGMVIGATLPLPFGDVLEDRLALGLGVYTPQQVLLRGNVYYPEVPQWPVLDRAQSLGILLGLGVDLHGTELDGLRLGFGIAAIADVLGQLDVRLDETNAFTSTVETQLLATFAPLVGVSYDRGEWSFGLSYRHELRAKMDLEIRTADLPVMLPVLTVGGIVQYDPAQLAAEVSYRPDPNLRIIANLTWRMWSHYPGAAVPTSASSYQAPHPEMSDVVSPRIAVEGTLRDARAALHLRAGYALEMSPSPEARLAPRRNPDGSPLMVGGQLDQVPLRLLDNDRHVATAGLGITWSFSAQERLRLDLFGQAHFLVDRVHLVERTGTDAAEAGEGMVTGGTFVVGGWTIALEF